MVALVEEHHLFQAAQDFQAVPELPDGHLDLEDRVDPGVRPGKCSSFLPEVGLQEEGPGWGRVQERRRRLRRRFDDGFCWLWLGRECLWRLGFGPSLSTCLGNESKEVIFCEVIAFFESQKSPYLAKIDFTLHERLDTLDMVVDDRQGDDA